MPNPIFTPGTPERKIFLKELNAMAKYTGEVLHGEELTPARERYLRKYFHRTYKMLHRIADLENGINNNSFKYGYGGKILARKILLQLEIIEKVPDQNRKNNYRLLLPKEGLDLELVSRIIVEVYLLRHEVEPI
jgi:hypothetical protein